MSKTKFCQLATEDGEYAVEIAAGESGIIVRAKHYRSRWGGWHKDIGVALAAITCPHPEVTAELCEKARQNQFYRLTEAIPEGYRTEADE